MAEAHTLVSSGLDTSVPAVVLIVPPFQALVRPSFGVGQLKANLEQAGIRTVVLYLNFLFAQRIGLEVYDWIGERRLSQHVGDVVFSHALFDRPRADLIAYLDDILAGPPEQELRRLYPDTEPIDALHQLVSAAADFCTSDAVPAILAHDPWLVGLSSSYQQNASSLAIIRALKRRRPDILTIMGGANCEGEMGAELLARFDDLDFVGQGECDHSLVTLAQALGNGSEGHSIPGILARGHPPAGDPRPLSSEDMENQPLANFDEFFEQIATPFFRNRIRPGLVMETARGCWWGAKSHCTFCGLNGQGMGFRSKSPERAHEQMTELVRRYKVPRVAVVDNIMDMGYFKSLLPRLAEAPVGDIFYETKSNLSREQVELLSRARVRWIQPGIESLSDRTLQLMRKGTSEIQNVQLLKWAAEYGVAIAWNFLLRLPR